MSKNRLFSKVHKIALAGILTGALLLTGCGSAIPEFSEENNELVSNYAADLLLMYGTNYDSRLVDTSIKPDDLLKLEEQWAAEDAAALAEENKPEESTDLPDDGGSNASSQSGSSSSGSSDSGIASDASENHTDLATALKVPSGVSVDFAGYDTYKSFVGGENNAFSLVANEGKQLLVVQLNFYNNNASDVELDFLDAFPNIIARTNNSHANSAQLTVLTNDLITYKGTIAAGSNQILALVFEISDSITSIDSMDFVVTIDGDVSVVTIF